MTLKSAEMKELVHSIPKIRPDNPYEYYIAKVNKLTGKEHSCPDLENYFGAISQ